MRKDISEKVEIPQGVEVVIEGDSIKIKKGGNEIDRKFSGFIIRKEENFLVLEAKKATKNIKKLLKTTRAHVQNAMNGLENKYQYKLQICAIHFPMTVTIDKAKNEMIIKNYLGEVKPRIAKLLRDVEVKVDKEIITVEGHDKEKAGQTAANIERAVRITNRDRRVFQDGIYITAKPE